MIARFTRYLRPYIVPCSVCGWRLRHLTYCRLGRRSGWY